MRILYLELIIVKTKIYINKVILKCENTKMHIYDVYLFAMENLLGYFVSFTIVRIVSIFTILWIFNTPYLNKKSFY